MTCACARFPRAFINGSERSDDLLEKKLKIPRDFFPKDRKQHCGMNKTTSHQTDPASTSAGTAEQQVVTQMIDEWFDGAAKPSLYLSTDGESILTSEGTPDPEISAVCFPIISPFSTTSSFSVRPAQSSDDVPVVYTAVWGSINRELERVKEAGYQYDLHHTPDGAGFHCEVAQDDLLREDRTWWSFATDQASSDYLWGMIERRHADFRLLEPEYPELPTRPTVLPWLYCDYSCREYGVRETVDRLLPVMHGAAWIWVCKRELHLPQEDTCGAPMSEPGKAPLVAWVSTRLDAVRRLLRVLGPNERRLIHGDKFPVILAPRLSAAKAPDPIAPTTPSKQAQCLHIVSPNLLPAFLSAERPAYTRDEEVLDRGLARYDFLARYENDPQFTANCNIELMHPKDESCFVCRVTDRDGHSSISELALNAASKRKLLKRMTRAHGNGELRGIKKAVKGSSDPFLYFHFLPATGTTDVQKLAGDCKHLMTVSILAWQWIRRWEIRQSNEPLAAC